MSNGNFILITFLSCAAPEIVKMTTYLFQWSDLHQTSHLISDPHWPSTTPFHMDKSSGHYTDVIMTTIASQITSLTVVYSTVYSDADQSKHQSSASLAFVWGIHRDRWIPHTKGQLRGKCFHLMMSSCEVPCSLVCWTFRVSGYVVNL